MTTAHHHRDRVAAAAVLAAALLAAGPAAAASDARSLAMAGAQTAAARSVEAASWNPAILAFSSGTSIHLVGVSADLHNNSLSLDRYNEISGATLSAAQKQELLDDIPDGGFALNGRLGAGALGVQWGQFAVTTGVIGAGRGNLDRDFFDLVLFGNELGETVDFSDTWGNAHAIGHASLSYGREVFDGPLGRIAVGATASYLYGIYEMHVEEAGGSLTTAMTEISGEAYASAVTAEGGGGFGLDLAGAWQAPGGWTFGLAIDNFVTNVNWSSNPERTELRITAADLNALNDDLDNAVADSDTTYAIGGYSTTLPRRVRLGAARDTGRLLLAADYVQGFTSRAGASGTPQLNLGAEWRPLGWLTPRAGVSLGGATQTGMAGGLGLQLGFWQLDLAVINRGGFAGGSTKGLGFGASTRLMF